MRRQAWAQSLVGPKLACPENWQNVDIDGLGPVELQLFGRRKRAVQLHLASDLTLPQISKQTGFSTSEIRRLVRRALTFLENGDVWGWAALLPHQRLATYTLKKESGKAGRWQQFLRKNEGLADQLNAWALAKKPANGKKAYGPGTLGIWLAFEATCKDAGMDTVKDYPFCNKDRGREAIRRHVRMVRKKQFMAGAIASCGINNVYTTGGKYRESDRNRLPEAPYHRVQLDGHRMDVELVVLLEDADGKTIELPLSRLWLLVLIDTASRAVLAYHISLEENYTCDDVLECLHSALVPWEPRECPEPGSWYNNGSGLPSGVIDECAYRAFNVVHLDNAFAHTSAWVQEKIIETFRARVVLNRPRRPRSNQIVERFNNSFERTSFHRWPSTTGSAPTDPKRSNSLKQAKWLRAEFDDIRLAADLAIANYNAASHSGLNGLSPLEYLQQRIDGNYDLLRFVGEKDPDRSTLFQKAFAATVRGNPKLGHYPYIQFMGVRYSSETLASSPDFIGEKVRVQFNVKDIRSAEVFHKGRSLGSVFAEARWMRNRHSLRTRRAVLRLIRRKQIDQASNNPVGAHLEYLEKRAKLSRKDRNRLLREQRAAKGAAKDSKNEAYTDNTSRFGQGRIRIRQTLVTR